MTRQPHNLAQEGIAAQKGKPEEDCMSRGSSGYWEGGRKGKQ